MFSRIRISSISSSTFLYTIPYNHTNLTLRTFKFSHRLKQTNGQQKQTVIGSQQQQGHPIYKINRIDNHDYNAMNTNVPIYDINDHQHINMNIVSNTNKKQKKSKSMDIPIEWMDLVQQNDEIIQKLPISEKITVQDNKLKNGQVIISQHPYNKHLPGAMLCFSDVIVDRAEGSWIYATNGTKYLDFANGIGVTNVGHSHPKVLAAAAAQMAKGVHLQQNCLMSPPVMKLANKLGNILPSSMKEDYQCFFSNSGAEAVENAVKLARHVTGKQCVIVFQGGFHGRTIATGAMTTAKYIYRAGFQPTMSGVFVAPYPYCARCPNATLCDESNDVNFNCCNSPLEQFKMLLKQQVAGDEVAAILVEPIQGEGGYIVPPSSFLKGLRAIADEIKCMLIMDEVQSGFGRTGTNFACEQFDVTPDIMVIAKGIANGFPLSGIVAPAKYFSMAKPGSIGGTYGGNAVSAAAACAVIDIFEQENVLHNVNIRGNQLRDGLKTLSMKYPGMIHDIRGLGLMNAIEFSDAAGIGIAGEIIKEAEKQQLLLLSCGVNEAIRFVPSLLITEQEMNTALQKLDVAMQNVFAKKQIKH